MKYKSPTACCCYLGSSSDSDFDWEGLGRCWRRWYGYGCGRRYLDSDLSCWNRLGRVEERDVVEGVCGEVDLYAAMLNRPSW